MEMCFSVTQILIDNFPWLKSAACLSLRLGSVISAQLFILYSLFSIQYCFVELSRRAPLLDFNKWEALLTLGIMITIIIVHVTSFSLSAMMMLGALKERAVMIKPWIVFKSVQLIVVVLLTMWVIIRNYEIVGHKYILHFLWIAIESYMLMIVASYYKELTENKAESERLYSIEKLESTPLSSVNSVKKPILEMSIRKKLPHFY
ncbi:uncharacterized protein LOC113238260 [Hyposmocoma kahamanoa]|uniref:uncharacterized protein LOC113238260 n=1 Tax=Hyposmocoma kahamanoa TaxID=1477025 RepID=UPI000E6D8AB6|nr:uncharacterized protein LOC113238260 [Hyposmocoma kahamanoa]